MHDPWLSKRITIPEAEAEHMHAGKPFGFMNDQWEQLKSEMLEGDELWDFSSPPETWAHLAGRAGIALVRDGKVIRSLITMMN